MGDLPVPSSSKLDRGALERVLARAAELQAGMADAPDEVLTEAQVVELGKEVGLSAEHLRQALAEERTRISVPRDEGWAGRIAGPAHASASRTVPGNPADILAMLDDWMQREECLREKRRFADRMTWDTRRDAFSALRRGLNLGGRGYDLARAHEVAATVVPVDNQRVLVRLDADLGPSRAARLRAATGTALTGTLAGAAPAGFLLLITAHVTFPLLILGGAMTAAGMALGSGAGLAMTRSYTHIVARTQLALEQILDRLEHGTMPRPSVLRAAIGAIVRG